MSWLWVVLLALAVAVLAGAEWPRLEGRIGFAVARRQERRKRKRGPDLHVVVSEEQEDFAASVERDLSLLPTIDEDERRRG